MIDSPSFRAPGLTRLSAIAVVFITLLGACKKDDNTAEQAQTDQEIIEKYIADNNLNAQATGSGLFYVIDDLGWGQYPDNGSTVRVEYTGYLTNGTVFDASGSGGVSFPLASTIEGWQEGIPYFKEGGSGMLLVPSALGYGTQSVGDIPPNSVLIFDIKLWEVN